MNPWIKPVINWFGFTRRERRASFILLVIIAIVFGIRFIVPEHTISVEEIPLDNQDTTESRKTATMSKEEPGFQARKEAGSVKTGSGTARPRGKQIVELNASDSAGLEALPGIGPVLSSRIIKYRNLIGGFFKVEQLKEVYGLSEETYRMISPKVKADSLLLRKIKINEADYRTLSRHPYFRREEVQSVIKYRDLEGSIKSMDELVRNKVISAETASKISRYLIFE